jgi:hypothetical protein
MWRGKSMGQPRGTELSFRVDGLRVESRGLSLYDHPELAIEVSDAAELTAARTLLRLLVVLVITGRYHFSAGEVIPLEGEILRLEEATLELWERDPETDRFHRGAPRLLASLQRGS